MALWSQSTLKIPLETRQNSAMVQAATGKVVETWDKNPRVCLINTYM